MRLDSRGRAKVIELIGRVPSRDLMHNDDLCCPWPCSNRYFPKPSLPNVGEHLANHSHLYLIPHFWSIRDFARLHESPGFATVQSRSSRQSPSTSFNLTTSCCTAPVFKLHDSQSILKRPPVALQNIMKWVVSTQHILSQEECLHENGERWMKRLQGTLNSMLMVRGAHHFTHFPYWPFICWHHVSAAQSFAPRVIENADDGRKRLAVVAFTNHGERLVISPAKRQAIVNSANTVFAFKRHIGRKFEVKEVTEDAAHWYVWGSTIVNGLYWHARGSRVLEHIITPTTLALRVYLAMLSSLSPLIPTMLNGKQRRMLFKWLV